MKTTNLADHTCTQCGAKFNAASDPKGDNSPRPGDFSICAYCGELAVFSDDMILRSPTEDEILQVSLIELIRIQAMGKAFRDVLMVDCETPAGMSALNDLTFNAICNCSDCRAKR